jgi:hypothetical protein
MNINHAANGSLTTQRPNAGTVVAAHQKLALRASFVTFQSSAASVVVETMEQV